MRAWSACRKATVKHLSFLPGPRPHWTFKSRSTRDAVSVSLGGLMALCNGAVVDTLHSKLGIFWKSLK